MESSAGEATTPAPRPGSGMGFESMRKAQTMQAIASHVALLACFLFGTRR